MTLVTCQGNLRENRGKNNSETAQIIGLEVYCNPRPEDKY